MAPNVREFLRRVLPWPAAGEQGYCNTHVMGKGPDGRTFWSGSPCTDVDQFLAEVHKALMWRTPPDIYMCMSRQSGTKITTKGDIRAAKSQACALALKSVFLDIDVKPKAFPTIAEAVQALTEFCAKYSLPPPTALVASGGGLHAHWISDKSLAPGEWIGYAEGMKTAALQFFGQKIDAGVIADSARVLRVPGTFNFKNGMRRPVKLLHLGDDDYDFSSALSLLYGIAPQSPTFAPSILSGRPAAIFTGRPAESLSAGLEREELPPLDWTTIGPKCGWFTEAVTTGGKDFSQGLWNLTTLAATFLENGHALAHRMARGHPGYSHGETEALWQRKLSERQTHRLGWPSCRSIQAEGSTHCAGCPILALSKSPLNLARVPQQARAGGVSVPGGQVPVAAWGGGAGPPVPPPVGPGASGAVPPPIAPGLIPITDIDLPDGFQVHNGLVCKVKVTKGGMGTVPVTEFLPMFHRPLYHPLWASPFPDCLRFQTDVDIGTVWDVVIPRSKMTSVALEQQLLDCRLAPVSKQLPDMKGFIMSWLAKLNAASASKQTVPFGWVRDGTGIITGFSYGGVMYNADGSLSPAPINDKHMRDIYGPTGDIQPWLDAYNAVMAQERPGLQIIMASSFAAPLMFAVGEYAVLMSVYGESGAHKSTAARIATAVWGKPVLAKEVETATKLSVINKLGLLKNLPYYWDEIKDRPAQQKAYDVLYVGSGGAEGGRMHSDITQQGKLTWCTLTGIFSNPPFGNFVLKTNPNTTAGLARLFEWKEEVPVVGAPGYMSPSAMGRMMMKLDNNFGQLGKQWAAFLGPNHALVYNHVEANSKFFEQAVFDPTRRQDPERYWIAFCAAVMSAAELANAHLGLTFDLPKIKSFLIDKLFAQRTRGIEENVQGGSRDHTEAQLTAFLKAMTRNTLRTRSMPNTHGRPSPVEPIAPFYPGFPCHVQWSLSDRLLRISRNELVGWLNRPEVEGDALGFIAGLKKHFGAKSLARGTLASGTQWSGGREPLIVIPYLPGSALAHIAGEPEDESAIAGLGSQASPGQQAGRSNGAALPLASDTELLMANPDFNPGALQDPS